MKILQLHKQSTHPIDAGGKRRVWEISKALHRAGHEVHLASPTSQQAPPDSVVSFHSIDSILWADKKFRTLGWHASFATSPYPLLTKLQEQVFLHNIPSSRVSFDLIVAEAPHMYPVAEKLANEHNATYIIDKHNAHFEILEHFLSSTAIPDFLHQRAVSNLNIYEQEAIDAADGIAFVSKSDREKFKLSGQNIAFVPHGSSITDQIKHASPARTRETHGLNPEKFSAVFIGTYDYEANREAAEFIATELAPQLPDIEFLLVGKNPMGIGPSNAQWLGFVENLGDVLTSADVALCPLTTGSGVSVKMYDYLASGLPIITTEIGRRGISSQERIYQVKLEEFDDAIAELQNDKKRRLDLTEDRFEQADKYSWDTATNTFLKLVRSTHKSTAEVGID